MASAVTGSDTALYILSSLAPPVLPPVYQALSPTPDSQHDQLSPGPCKTPIKLYRCLRYNPFFSLQSLRCASQDMRMEKHCTYPSFVRTTHESQSVGHPDRVQHQLSPRKLRIPIPGYTSYNTISPSYTPLPGVMTALTLRTSLILVVEFHTVCRSTICGDRWTARRASLGS